MKEKINILVTNDDGITAPGIAHLIQVMKEFGNVIVVAPDSPQSGMGHAVTITQPLRLDKVDLFQDVLSYQCSGTPADCVKLAVDKVLHTKPDLVVSGINHGSNASINVLYSGTMSAAIEGAIENIPSIGFSLCDYSDDANFEHVIPYIRQITGQVLQNGLPAGTLLNVNFPKFDENNKIKGTKICRQAIAKWEENFEERSDPNGRSYYWLVGKFKNYDEHPDTDLYALKENFVSIVPTQFDLTSYPLFNSLSKWTLDE